jgi:hypothetical protein
MVRKMVKALSAYKTAIPRLCLLIKDLSEVLRFLSAQGISAQLQE